jgi:catechol 2,3-dioxygenase-like lactoylglutathione lyase family enzyme
MVGGSMASVVPQNSVGAITLFVEDVQRARSFYESVFGVSPVYEDESSAAYRFENLLVNVLDARSAGELVEPAAVGGTEGGSRLLLTIWVEDTDAACAELAKRGVSLLNGPVDREWGVRTAAFADPDGHVWELAQELPASTAR